MRGRPLESKTKDSAYTTWALRRALTSIVLMALLLVLVHIMALAGFGLADKIDVVGMLLSAEKEQAAPSHGRDAGSAQAEPASPGEESGE